MPHAASKTIITPASPLDDESVTPTSSPESSAAAHGLPLADCNCVRTRHTHGDYISYKHHRCRCEECTTANTIYCRSGRVRRKRIAKVPAGLARDRVRELQALGLLLVDISEMCGLGPKGLDNLMYGKDGRPLAQIYATTLAALKAIDSRAIREHQPPDTRQVDSTSARLQIQSLHAAGWTAREIARHAGVSPSALSYILIGRDVREAIRQRIDAAYIELRDMEPPQGTKAERANMTTALNKAAAHGWTTDSVHDLEYPAIRAA